MIRIATMEPLRGQTKAALSDDCAPKRENLDENEANQQDDRDPGSCVREKYEVPEPAVDRAILGTLSDH
jgi:hypothetical protein